MIDLQATTLNVLNVDGANDAATGTDSGLISVDHDKQLYREYVRYLLSQGDVRLLADAFLRECARVLEPGGTMRVIVPDLYSLGSGAWAGYEGPEGIARAVTVLLDAEGLERIALAEAVRMLSGFSWKRC